MRMGPADWVLGGIVVGALVLNEPLKGLDNTGSQNWSRVEGRQAFLRIVGRDSGHPAVAIGLATSVHLAGRIGGNETLSRLGFHSLAGYLSTQLITHAIKVSAGRARPYLDTDPDHFDHFTFDADYLSFPSGHSSGAFVLAAVVSSELGERHPWVPYLAYPLAGWTATTRVLDRRHWVTDVVAGSALGILTGRLVEGVLHSERVDAVPGLEVAPAQQGGMTVGLRFSVR